MNTVAAVLARTAGRARADAVRRLVEGGGRFSTALGIDAEAGEAETDRWFLAATLSGTRTPIAITERSFQVLDEAGMAVVTAWVFSWDDLVSPLDGNGYASYDFKTATRLDVLCDVLSKRYGDRVCALPEQARTPPELEAARDDLPRVVVRHRRRVSPGAAWRVAACRVGPRCAGGGVCPSPRPRRRARRRPPDLVRSLSTAAGVDPRRPRMRTRTHCAGSPRCSRCLSWWA